MLLLGEGDQITLSNNHFHDVSGRAPKVGNELGITLHAVNNYFSNSDGHNFDIGKGANVLMEGNVFESCKKPIESDASKMEGSLFNVPNSIAASQCTSHLGRTCVINIVKDSGAFPEYTATAALSAFSSAENITTPISAEEVVAYVQANAGIGKLNVSPSSVEIKVASSTEPVASLQLSTVVKLTITTTVTKASSNTSKVAAITTTAVATPVTAPVAATSDLALYAQCGGKTWSGVGSCPQDSTCKEYNE